MPNYSSSKSAWPTFNLPNMGGGGVTRPQIRMTKTKESTKLQVGPTRTASAEKARKDAEMAYELRKAEARAAKKSGKRTAQEQADYDAVYAGTADAATQARFDKGADKEAMAADKRAGAQDAAERAAIKKQDAAFEKQRDAKMLKNVTKFDAAQDAQDSAVVAEAKRVAALDKKEAADVTKARNEYLKEVAADEKAGIKDPNPQQTAAAKAAKLAQQTAKKPYIHKTKTSKTKNLKTGPEYFGGEEVGKRKTPYEDAQQ